MAKSKTDLIKDRDQAMDDFRGHIAEDASTVKSAERIFKAAEHSLKQALKAQAKLKAFGKPKVKKLKRRIVMLTQAEWDAMHPGEEPCRLKKEETP